MRKYVALFITICIIVCFIFYNYPKDPQVISSITTMDTVYLTILVNQREARNRKKLEEKIIEMCKTDSFDSIKLWTGEKNIISRWNISVYSSRRELKKGTAFMIIKHQEGE